jgi:hypothetical protein
MAHATTPTDISPSSDIYKTSRGQIEFFGSSISQRVIWLSIGQSFFFGVYATLVSIKAPSPDLLAKQHILTVILPIAALLNAIVTLFDVASALYYMQKLRHRYEDATKDISSDTVYPNIWGKATDRMFQHSSPTLIPVIFIVSWAIILVCTYR